MLCNRWPPSPIQAQQALHIRFCSDLDTVKSRGPQQHAADDVAEHGRQPDGGAEPATGQGEHHDADDVLQEGEAQRSAGEGAARGGRGDGGEKVGGGSRCLQSFRGRAAARSRGA